MITCEGLGKRFSAVWVFRRVEFSLSSGECLLVTGRNGAGKSTLLKVLAGLEPASEGTLRREFVPRQELGYSAMDLSLYPLLTASEHLELAARLRGLADSRTGELLDRVGLSGNAERVAGVFSTGMRARLKLALAIQGNPRALLLDEPSAGLDEQGRALIEATIAEQRTRGVAILASNDPSERRYGDYELILGD